MLIAHLSDSHLRAGDLVGGAGQADVRLGWVERVEPVAQHRGVVAPRVGGDEHDADLPLDRLRHLPQCRGNVGHRRGALVRAVGVAGVEQGDLAVGGGAEVVRRAARVHQGELRTVAGSVRHGAVQGDLLLRCRRGLAGAASRREGGDAGDERQHRHDRALHTRIFAILLEMVHRRVRWSPPAMTKATTIAPAEAITAPNAECRRPDSEWAASDLENGRSW